MAILRYTASADTTITNAFEANLDTRGTGSNMGFADSLEVFSIYGQSSSSVGQTQELSRALIKFPISSISAARQAGVIPASSSVSFYLKLYNARHPWTLPQNFNLVLAPITTEWIEGTGLDMSEYKDLGNANWTNANNSTSWTTIGGDYSTDRNYNINFQEGHEDVEVNITDLVEDWIDNTITNYGLGIRLTASQEGFFSSSTGTNTAVSIHNPDGATESYYTKKFFARSTEFFFKRPIIEARWDSRVLDDRDNFYYSSSLAPARDNLNTIYLYNYVRGRLVNIPSVGTGEILVSLYSGSTAPTGPKMILYDGNTNITGGYVSTGIYSASVGITASTVLDQPLSVFYDVWHSGSTEYFTGSLFPEKFPTYDSAPTFSKVTSIRNLKKSYSSREKTRFRFFIRDKNWNPTIYNKAKSVNPTEIITSASYAIYRVTDNLNVIPYGTGSDFSTYTSYDKEGNYFDLDMSLLEKGYMYEIKLSYYNDSIGDWQEQPQTFKFRVDE